MFGGRCPGEGQLTERGATARGTKNLPLYSGLTSIGTQYTYSVLYLYTLADLGFLKGVTGNPSERSERALRGSGLTGE